MATTDGCPKDYSSEYNEALRAPIPQFRVTKPYKTLDGACARPSHREVTDFIKRVHHKQKTFTVAENQKQLGIDILNRHYDTIFTERRKKCSEFNVYIQYFKFDLDGNKKSYGETYLVKVERNTLKLVKDKLPNKREGFRYFFKDCNNTCEEIDNEDQDVPYTEKCGGETKTIYCQVFMPSHCTFSTLP